MDNLKCIGVKCPNYKEHEFRLSYFTCKLDGFSYKQDFYRERECRIPKIIHGKRIEILELEDLLERVKGSWIKLVF